MKLTGAMQLPLICGCGCPGTARAKQPCYLAAPESCGFGHPVIDPAAEPHCVGRQLEVRFIRRVRPTRSAWLPNYSSSLRTTIRTLTLMTAASLAACDPGALLSEPPPSVCVESGAQCQLPDGPLGVCEVFPCGPDQGPPCFTCTPQH